MGGVGRSDLGKIGTSSEQFYFPAFGVLGMGDLNAVDVAQRRHTRVLEDAGCMLPPQVLSYGRTVPPGKLWEGLYIDDHIFSEVLSTQRG